MKKSGASFCLADLLLCFSLSFDEFHEGHSQFALCEIFAFAFVFLVVVSEEMSQLTH